MDNITFKKIWIDSNPAEDFFQLKVTASNSGITMSSNVYAQSRGLIRLQKGTRKILKKPYSITMGNDDDSYIGCVKLSFSSNKRGVVEVSIFMKSRVDNAAKDNKANDTASFQVFSDVASLDRFAKNLNQIIKGDIGASVSLHE